MNKIVIGIIILLVIGGGIYLLNGSSQTGSPDLGGEDDSMETASPSPAMSAIPEESGSMMEKSPTAMEEGISSADVAKHNSKTSCWTIIDGKVYDLTEWIGQHPGGQQAILSLCGKDGTEAFRNQHDHNKKQENLLVGFYKGDLAK
ncbi:MAG: hypothetical protein COU07_00970 [Candidatus Harrisonbacteria bacterium CG10_big_fil_rev_8_21_14_0_10_40_38]|uniref:Cytochrome b5 heme-binding domain-containing protein n=1 Tax=Candidatus Harrisonbacteria bacterium CG10_big_fil_rev_8_21_14_0_10_40_38 TaxID=1974583 RepID=A0A2H0UST7_9BACT|nr:MAG: hypothetical protein COU07_00970 [Candidatus Harrisonbacteria bacterium CG10_big_fil_rev_8_21_14_0_10_40_38]